MHAAKLVLAGLVVLVPAGETGAAPGDPIDKLIDAAQPRVHRCPDCPLPVGIRRSCPAALAIRPVLEASQTRRSIDQVRMIVERDGTRTEATVPTQRALRSLIGLLLPLSACPVMMKLRPMAHLHLPLCGKAHTAFRFLGMHLIVQHLRRQDGATDLDWELKDLLALFGQLHTVNRHLADRIRAAPSRTRRSTL